MDNLEKRLREAVKRHQAVYGIADGTSNPPVSCPLRLAESAARIGAEIAYKAASDLAAQHVLRWRDTVERFAADLARTGDSDPEYVRHAARTTDMLRSLEADLRALRETR